MADYREMRHGFEVVLSAMKQRQAFVAALDDCCPGVAQDAIDNFSKIGTHFFNETYIASVSEHLDGEDQHGRLSMWRAFGGSSARVAIVVRIPFRVEGVEQLNCNISPVSYSTNVETEFARICASIRERAPFLRTLDPKIVSLAIYNMLIVSTTCTKHPGFEEEREWRAVYNPTLGPSRYIERTTETIAGIPQIIHKLPMDRQKTEQIPALDFAKLFDRIIIGPTTYSVPLAQAFDQALRSAGVIAPNVVVSGIPLRF